MIHSNWLSGILLSVVLLQQIYCGDGLYFLIIINGLLVVFACSLPNQIVLKNKTLCLQPWRFIDRAAR